MKPTLDQLTTCLDGKWPVPCHLNPQPVETIQADGYQIESLSYEVEPGDRVAAMLLVHRSNTPEQASLEFVISMNSPERKTISAPLFNLKLVTCGQLKCGITQKRFLVGTWLEPVFSSDSSAE